MAESVAYDGCAESAGEEITGDVEGEICIAWILGEEVIDQHRRGVWELASFWNLRDIQRLHHSAAGSRGYCHALEGWDPFLSMDSASEINSGRSTLNVRVWIYLILPDYYTG